MGARYCRELLKSLTLLHGIEADPTRIAAIRHENGERSEQGTKAVQVERNLANLAFEAGDRELAWNCLQKTHSPPVHPFSSDTFFSQSHAFEEDDFSQLPSVHWEC